MADKNLSEFIYYAFISYKREDENWAKRLHKKLESYGFPVALRKDNPDLPSKIRPIFRDQSELSGGNLKEEIEKGLKGSKYLIVICSPRAAHSPWVSKEVQYFIDNGRENYIIPFIIGGSPNAKNPEEECFPEGLRQLSGEKEILGININEMGRDAAAIKVIAQMFNLRFDTLWQRHERAKRRKRLGVIAGVLAFALISLAVAGIMLDLKQQANSERDKALQANQSLELANKSLKLANDSIKRQSEVITKANNNLRLANDSIKHQAAQIAQANQNLAESNRRLAEERDNVKKANWKMMENRARAVAKKANQLIDEGNSYLAQLLCLEVLPLDLKKPDKPYMPEVEEVLRRALSSNHVFYSRAHDSGISSIDYSPDGNQIVTGSFDSTIKIWDANNGDLMGTCKANNGQVTSVTYNNIGSLFASGADEGIIKIWDSKTRECIHSINTQHKLLRSIQFSPDSKYIASCSDNGMITLWDLESEKLVAKFGDINSPIMKIIFSSDGKSIISASGNLIKIWDINKQIVMQTMPTEHTELITDITCSKDGMYIVSCSNDKTIKIWDIYKNNCIKTLYNHTGAINSVSYSNDNHFLISGGFDNMIIIWDPTNWSPVHTIYSPGLIMSAKINNNNTQVAWGGFNEYLSIYNINNEDNKLCSLPNSVTGVGDINPSNSMYGFGMGDGRILIGDLLSCNNSADRKFNILYGHNQPSLTFMFNQDGTKAVSCSMDSTIKVWDIKNNFQKSLSFYYGGNYGAFFFPNNDNMVLYYGKGLGIWDMTTNKIISIPTGIDNKINCAIISPDSRYLIYSSNKLINIYDIINRTHINTFEGDSQPISLFAISNDNKYLVSATNDRSLKLWDMQSFECIEVWKNLSSSITSIAFSPNGNVFSVGTIDGYIQVFDLTAMKIIANFHAHDNAIGRLVYGKDGDLFSISGDHTIKHWRFPTLQEIINSCRVRFNKRTLTIEEREKYYIE